MVTKSRPWFATLFLLSLFSASSSNAEWLASDFSSTGFDWLCCGFSQSIGADAVTLQSNDGWGIADLNTGGVDLSAYSDEYFRIRIRPNVGNGAENLEMALVDTAGNEAKWFFDFASQTDPGEWATLRAATPISQPNSGTNDWQNLNLSDIQQVRLLGHWQHPDPFNLSVDQISLTEDAYDGMAADASWRTEAADRIDSIRKADLEVRVTDQRGVALSGAHVHVAMQKHEFGFGSTLAAWRIRDNDPDHAAYQQKVVELFNAATIENNLKWLPWEGNWGDFFSQEGALAALDWLDSQGIETRGHNMVWPSVGHVPADVEAMIQAAPLSGMQQQELRDRINAHIADVGTATAGRVNAWDVVNEPRTEHDLMDVLSEGNLAMVEWFQEARKADPNARLYLNDYSIITGENGNRDNRDLYFETLQMLLDNGAPLDGVGFQGHFREGSLTSPEKLWQILDRFAELGLDMQVTEFDFETTDETLQAQYTNDFLTAIFAHEGIDDFIMWGFWEDQHWRPEAAMFRSDWSIKPNGEAYTNLVFNEWWTDESKTADGDGKTSVRGFQGDYQIRVDYQGVEQTVNVQLSDDGTSVLISLPMVLGDFNHDFSITAADIDLLATRVRQNDQSSSFDLDRSGQVDAEDHAFLVAELLNTWLGDSNLDGRFDSSDLVQVFRTGNYEDDLANNSTWATGDWNGDTEFDTSDLVAAFQGAGYDAGERASASVSEPVSEFVFVFGLLGLVLTRGAFRECGAAKLSATN